jgi:hypothetical protein
MSPMFIPGPVDVDPAVLAAQTQPMLPHRSQEFETIFRNASEKAKIYFIQARVFISACPVRLQTQRCNSAQARSCLHNMLSERWYGVAMRMANRSTTRIPEPANPGGESTGCIE